MVKLAGGKFYEQETAETRSIASGSEQDDYVSRRAPSTAPAFLLRKAGQKNLSLDFIDKLNSHAFARLFFYPYIYNIYMSTCPYFYLRFAPATFFL